MQILIPPMGWEALSWRNLWITRVMRGQEIVDFCDNTTACADHAHQKMQVASRLMAGVFVLVGHHKLGTTALEKDHMCVEAKRQKEIEAAQKKEEEENKLRQKVLAVCQKEEASWNQWDIRTMVSWFKCPGDSKMPSKKQQLVE